MKEFRISTLRHVCAGFRNKHDQTSQRLAVVPGKDSADFRCALYNGKLTATYPDNDGKTIVTCSGCTTHFPQGFKSETNANKI